MDSAQKPKVQAQEDKKEEKLPQVPTTNIDAPLKIEEAISNPNIPQSDINAPLNVETDPAAQEGENQEKSSKKLFTAGSVLGAVIIVAAIGFYFFLPKNNQDESGKQPAQSTQQPAPQQEFVRSEWSLEVLNGSGVPGAAKKEAARLESLGYRILTTGNAPDNVANTQIFISNNLDASKEKLLEDVKGDFAQATIAGELKDSTASAKIIVGKN